MKIERKGRQEESKRKNRNEDDSDLAVVSSVIPFIIIIKYINYI